jgi:hypothetical protein
LRRALFVLAVLVGSPPAAIAQTNLSVDVHVSRVSMRADTVRVEYRVRNAADSREDLWKFTAEAPSRVIRIERPRPNKNWDASTTYKTLSVASWASLETHVSPGATTPPLVFEAVGLPGPVTYWAMGWFPVPQYESETEPPPPMSPREVIAASNIEGRTVGIDSLPADRSPRALLRRLQGLLDTACGELAWIRSAALCSRLGTKLEQAQQSVARGRTTSTLAQLDDFLKELASHYNRSAIRPVSDAAFWLLKVNGEYVLGRVRSQRCGSGSCPP